MRLRDVYRGEMSDRLLTDLEVEKLLSAVGSAQGRFATALRSLHETGPTAPSKAQVETFAAAAAEISLMREATGQTSGVTKPLPYRWAFRVKRKLAGAMAAAIFISGMTGVAVAANGAKPGDLLYGLDQALETIGIGDGGVAERITEAQSLIDEGETSSAITQIADLVQEEAPSSVDSYSPEAAKASEALRGAAERLRGDEVGPAEENLRSAVAAILDEIATMLQSDEFDGQALGARIAEMARALGVGEGSPAAGKPESPGADRGRSGEAPRGPPANPGEQGGSNSQGGPSGENPGRSSRP
jgi:hypothetical protein